MAVTTSGSFEPCADIRGSTLPLLLWKTTVTVPTGATSVSVASSNKASGMAVAVWIDPTTLTASATIKGYSQGDGRTTKSYWMDYTVPDPAVETSSGLNARTLVFGKQQIDVASATAGDSFVIYVYVLASADDPTISVDSEAMGTAIGEAITLGVDDAVYADDADWTDGTSKHLLVGGLYQSSAQTVTDGDVAPLLIDANGHLQVDALSAVVAGSVAHDSADSGNPVKLGAKAISASPTAVAANDRSDLYSDLLGQLRVNPFHINLWKASEDETGAATDDEIVAAPAAGLSLYVTDIMVTNDSTAAITFKLIEDTASAKTALMGTQKIAASGGFVMNLTTPIKLTAAKNLGYTTTGTSNYSVFVAGFTAA